MSTTAPADWYPDPLKAGRLRYWDGAAWTGYLVDLGRPGVVYQEKTPWTPGSLNVPLSVALSVM